MVVDGCSFVEQPFFGQRFCSKIKRKTRYAILGRSSSSERPCNSAHGTNGSFHTLFFCLRCFRAAHSVCSCLAHVKLMSSPGFILIEVLQIGHRNTRTSLVERPTGHEWVSYTRCSRQKTLWHASQVNGKKSCSAQSFASHLAPRSPNSVIASCTVTVTRRSQSSSASMDLLAAGCV